MVPVSAPGAMTVTPAIVVGHTDRRIAFGVVGARRLVLVLLLVVVVVVLVVPIAKEARQEDAVATVAFIRESAHIQPLRQAGQFRARMRGVIDCRVVVDDDDGVSFPSIHPSRRRRRIRCRGGGRSSILPGTSMAITTMVLGQPLDRDVVFVVVVDNHRRSSPLLPPHPRSSRMIPPFVDLRRNRRLRRRADVVVVGRKRHRRRDHEKDQEQQGRAERRRRPDRRGRSSSSSSSSSFGPPSFGRPSHSHPPSVVVIVVVVVIGSDAPRPPPGEAEAASRRGLAAVRHPVVPPVRAEVATTAG